MTETEIWEHPDFNPEAKGCRSAKIKWTPLISTVAEIGIKAMRNGYDQTETICAISGLTGAPYDVANVGDLRMSEYLKDISRQTLIFWKDKYPGRHEIMLIGVAIHSQEYETFEAFEEAVKGLKKTLRAENRKLRADYKALEKKAGMLTDQLTDVWVQLKELRGDA